MSDRLRARIDALPPPQRRLWPTLAAARGLGFVLYGGTAVALRLGHRISEDFDFFTDRSLDHDALREAFPFVAGAKVLLSRPDTWTALVASGSDDKEGVKVSFFGNVSFGRVGNPTVTEDGVMEIASLDDLMATKLKVLLQRIQLKDYLDIAAMLKAGLSLSKGLAGARLLFGPSFQPSECLKALTYFGGGDLALLTDEVKEDLKSAAVAVRDLPQVGLAAPQLSTSHA